MTALAQTSFSSKSSLIDSDSRSITGGAHVQFLFPEQVTLPAGKASAVSLHFKVAPNFHINSHTPHDQFLIPTELKIPASSGVRLEKASYPPGHAFSLPVDPTTKLSVYSGEFSIETHLVAERGNHLIQATLRYQACDNNACMPPKTINVPIDVIGK
ncbi:MAG: disulfide bond formation protein DsbC [Acidobacteriota bacterium]|nr:disulfide bond formation protein DsbC [Acidobacteriota bacterium]